LHGTIDSQAFGAEARDLQGTSRNKVVRPEVMTDNNHPVFDLVVQVVPQQDLPEVRMGVTTPTASEVQDDLWSARGRTERLSRSKYGQSKRRRLSGTAEGPHLETVQQPDSDEESPAPSIFSDMSIDSIESSAMTYSEVEMVNATKEYYNFIANDEIMSPLFNAAAKSSGLSAGEFEAKIRISLKKFARELYSEAESETQREAIPFISRRAKSVAHDLVNVHYRPSQGTQASTQAVEMRSGELASLDESSTDEDDKDETVVEDLPDVFSGIRQFLLQSAAFAKLRETVHRMLTGDQHSWDNFKRQWKAELRFELPHEVRMNRCIELVQKDQLSPLDRLKIALESYSGEEWLWDPFTMPHRPIPEGKVRVQWQCVSF
jgi:hypothetical protein